VCIWVGKVLIKKRRNRQLDGGKEERRHPESTVSRAWTERRIRKNAKQKNKAVYLKKNPELKRRR